MSKAKFEDTSVDAALEKAAQELGAEVADLEHEVVEEKTDFWGTGAGTVVIKAWTKAQETAAEEPTAEETTAPAESDEAGEPESATPAKSDSSAEPGGAEPAPREEESGAPEASESGAEGGFWASEDGAEETPSAPPESAPRDASVESDEATPAKKEAVEPSGSPQQDGEAAGVDADEVSRLLMQIFHDMQFDCSVEMTPEDGGFLATVEGVDKEALLEGNGRCLSALELIANNAFRHKLPRGSKISVDAGDFRERRDEELSDLAFQVAHSAKQSGRTQETQPLNPYERRLVHLALADDADVTTMSRGNGFLKNVQVVPARKGRGGRGGGRGRGGRS